MITVSVPGKIHLMGEHAVVYGTPALLAAINLRMRVAVEASEKMEVISTESPEYVLYAVQKVKEHFHLSSIPAMRITVDSDIPAGFHLGSSAATAVATVAAVTYFLKKIWNPTLFNQIAYEAEKKQHGNPSGGDNTIVTMGGILWFRKELEFLKSMWQLDIKIPSSVNHFFLINTGRPTETTGDMVALVRKRFEKNRRKMRNVFFQNEEQAKNITIALKDQNEEQLLNAMSKGEETLERMGVVGKKVIPFIRAVEKNGGATKILGGGGKRDGVGFLLCYHKEQSVVEEIGKKFGYATQPVLLGGDGVKLEKK
ncbi:MAG: mevalonate kinase [Microgenomates group bacterium]